MRLRRRGAVAQRDTAQAQIQYDGDRHDRRAQDKNQIDAVHETGANIGEQAFQQFESAGLAEIWLTVSSQ